LRQELPGWLREDPEFRQWILNFTCNEFTDRRETESRFDRIGKLKAGLTAYLTNAW